MKKRFPKLDFTLGFSERREKGKKITKWQSEKDRLLKCKHPDIFPLFYNKTKTNCGY